MHVSPLNVPSPAWPGEELIMFEDSADRFLKDHATPSATQRWREDVAVPRELWIQGGRAGLLCLSTPEEYGGMGGDYRHEVVLMEQLGRHGAVHWGVSLHDAIVAPYITRTL